MLGSDSSSADRESIYHAAGGNENWKVSFMDKDSRGSILVNLSISYPALVIQPSPYLRIRKLLNT